MGPIHPMAIYFAALDSAPSKAKAPDGPHPRHFALLPSYLLALFDGTSPSLASSSGDSWALPQLHFAIVFDQQPTNTYVLTVRLLPSNLLRLQQPTNTYVLTVRLLFLETPIVFTGQANSINVYCPTVDSYDVY